MTIIYSRAENQCIQASYRFSSHLSGDTCGLRTERGSFRTPARSTLSYVRVDGVRVWRATFTNFYSCKFHHLEHEARWSHHESNSPERFRSFSTTQLRHQDYPIPLVSSERKDQVTFVVRIFTRPSFDSFNEVVRRAGPDPFGVALELGQKMGTTDMNRR